MIELLPFQQEDVHQMNQFGGRVLLANSMGLGKTACTVHWIGEKFVERSPVIIVCPAPVKPNWERHIFEMLGVHPIILEGRTTRSLSTGLATNNIILINYDIVPNWLGILQAVVPKTIVLDESQYCANPQTKRTKACMQLAKKAAHILALSGTPLMNRPRELFPTLHMVRPDVFPQYWPFAKRYCGPKMTPWGWKFDGATHLKELHHTLRQTCMIRRTKEEVLKDLPGIIRETVTIELSPRHRQEYDKASNSFIKWLREKNLAKAKRASRAEQFVRAGALKRLAAKMKLRFAIDWTNNWLREADPEEKIVIFGVHRRAIRILQENIKTKSVLIDGTVSSKHRKAIIEQFRKDPKTRACFGTILSTGTGVDGLQIASTAMFVELPWRPTDCRQAEDRLNRIGAQKTTWVYYLVAADTIEERLCHLLQRKEETVSSVLDNIDPGTNSYVFDQLIADLL